MNAHARLSTFPVIVATLAAGPVSADDSFGKDLMATIALQGQPCDQVIDARRNGDSDYVATCKDGHRYHVYVNAQGRVVVEKL
ncbi:MAG: hypothetical protein KGL25_14195 [Gammaproteobacteria bacterium]|nr:hypothetical protein [Gammaproteobacteria bacterium]MDE2252545.1 hypothetical protein [Gammaproteobacteria bacterium]